MFTFFSWEIFDFWTFFLHYRVRVFLSLILVCMCGWYKSACGIWECRRSVLRGCLSKRFYPVFTGILKKTTENSRLQSRFYATGDWNGRLQSTIFERKTTRPLVWPCERISNTYYNIYIQFKKIGILRKSFICPLSLIDESWKLLLMTSRLLKVIFMIFFTISDNCSSN